MNPDIPNLGEEKDLPPKRIAIIKACNEVTTRGFAGERNGELFEILNKNTDINLIKPGEEFQQIYMTTLRARVLKGFHVHEHKVDTFFPVMGSVAILVYNKLLEKGEQITRENFNPGLLEVYPITTGAGIVVVQIPAGYAHAIYNTGHDEARVCNYCTPAYTPETPDQWEIEDPTLSTFVLTRLNF